MSFQAIVEAESNINDLQQSLDNALRSVGSVSVVGQGLDYGDSKTRVALLLDTAQSDWILQAVVFSDGSFDDLDNQVSEWLGRTPCRVFGLSLSYGNSKWRVLITYTVQAVDNNIVKSEKEGGAEAEAQGITQDLASAKSVSGFGFAYQGSDFAAMVIYTQ